MKKLVFMLAAVAMAVAANAATVNWSFGKDTAYNGWTVYAFDSANQATILAALAAYDADAQTTIDGLVLGSQAVSKGNAKKSGTDVGDATSLMLLAINGAFEDGNTFKYDTLSLSGWTFEPPNPAPDGYANLASFGNSGTIVAKGGGGGGGGESGGVPEPTSGLLLALGGAMLALRRRRS